MELRKGEIVIKQNAVTCVWGGIIYQYSWGGVIYLTNQRVVFKYYPWGIFTKELEIPLTEITNVSKVRLMRQLIESSIKVEYIHLEKSGSMIFYPTDWLDKTASPDEWVAQIRKAAKLDAK
jgi:hypothetical protein